MTRLTLLCAPFYEIRKLWKVKENNVQQEEANDVFVCTYKEAT